MTAPAAGDDADATLVSGAAPAGDADATVVIGAKRVGDPDATLVSGAAAAGDADATLLDPSTVGAEDATITGPAAARLAARHGSSSAAAGGPLRGTAAEDTGPLRPGQDFGQRYHIIKLLGLGGMGAVYQAWDKELELVVAIKIIRPEAAADPAMATELEQRFKRELLLAREVTHKNVVRIHDLGEIDGIKYITMSFIDGEDLRTVVRTRGALPVSDALKIMRSVVAGLGAAHDAGVVHRDLKPANIMVDARTGEGVIMDFGIARSASGSGDERPAPGGHIGKADFSKANLGQTEAGAIVGTIAYMPPEQARGEQADWRSDLYSLGLIFYDVLTGEHRAASAPSALSELDSRTKSAPPPVRAVVPGLPEALDALIMRCLAPNPADRFENPGDLRAALDRLDDNGVPLPAIRRLTPRMVAATAVVVAALLAGTWWISRSTGPVEQPDPISVLIADFENTTGDDTFDGTLEPTLTRALDEAGFVTAYDRLRLPSLGVSRTEHLDAAAAREVAAQQGLGVVLSGSIASRGSGYELELTATQTVTGEEITRAEGRARSKDQVMEVVTRLITRVRKALGDETPESSQQFAMATLSATSLDVISEYASAMEASSASRFDEARQHAAKAVELDPNFGIGYLVLAVAAGNVGDVAAQDRHLAEALRHLDGMTERERYTTRGYSYWAAGDYQQCVKEYSDLISIYPADIGGRNTLALCLSNLREMRRAMEEIQAIIEILPSHPIFRDNLALYANYASDFQTAETTALGIEAPDPYATLALAFAQVAQGRTAEATRTYEKLAQLPPPGPSYAASGLGDVAAFEGRFSEAVEILRAGAAADLEAGLPASAAAKLVAVAHAELSRGATEAAVRAAEEALGHGDAVKIRFLAARTLVEAGDTEKARPLIDGLSRELYAEPRAYAKLLEGGIALEQNDPRQAMILMREANELFDTWIGTYDLGRASFAAGLYPQADGAFDTCLNARRGEALSLFVDEEPTFAYLPRAYYYQGRAREEIGTAGFRDAYARYLEIRGASAQDPLVPDVRARIGG